MVHLIIFFGDGYTYNLCDQDTTRLLAVNTLVKNRAATIRPESTANFLPVMA